MKWVELKKELQDYEKDNHTAEHLTAEVVFTADSFTKPFTKEQRTYRFSSENKAFKPNMIGYSIFASCIDGTDNGVRIERYMEEEQARGEKYSWKVEDAYIVKE